MIYSAEILPHPSRWGPVVRIHVTAAARMDGPFEVWTDDGLVSCEDGWLVLDDHGNPYAVAAEEFERCYRPAGEVFIGKPGTSQVVPLDIENRVRRRP